MTFREVHGEQHHARRIAGGCGEAAGKACRPVLMASASNQTLCLAVKVRGGWWLANFAQHSDSLGEQQQQLSVAAQQAEPLGVLAS